MVLVSVFNIDVRAAKPSLSDSSLTAVKEQLLRYSNQDSSLSQAIARGLEGYQYYDSLKALNGRLIIIDFTKASFDKRIYVFDLADGQLLYNNYVAHGRNSGLVYPKKFSNVRNSFTSSLGFYKTAETYWGKHGLSLRLDGLEHGINHNARARAIVIHSAKYANPDFIKQHGRLGRSFGCPTLPEKDYLKILDIVKEGALLYIHYPDQAYLQNSKI